MRFIYQQAEIDCGDMVSGSPDRRRAALRDAAVQAASQIHSGGVVAFRLGRLRLPVNDSRELAHAIATVLLGVLVKLGVPCAARLEIDKPQETYVPAGWASRSLLPHFDGQHCSYLTPSTIDMPDWPDTGRLFGSSSYTTTNAHKMYQGIFLPDHGEGLSVTTYYDWIAILRTVRQQRGLGSYDDPAETIAQWLGGNLRSALRRQSEHGCNYPSVGAMLGLAEPMWNGLPFHHAEADLSSEDRLRYPEAIPLTEHCPCGECEGQMARIFCHQMLIATGLTWRDFRARWEVLVPNGQCDLIFGHNLTMLHGGWAGGRGRIIEPLCVVMDEPRGTDYERWLAASWRHVLPEER